MFIHIARENCKFHLKTLKIHNIALGVYMYFFLLQYYFNFNHMNDSLAPLDIFYKDKKQKDLISDN